MTTVVRCSLWNVYKVQAKDACHGPLFPSSRLLMSPKGTLGMGLNDATIVTGFLPS